LHNQCAIPTTDWVGDKEGANFCDEFVFRDASADTKDRDVATTARKTLDSLFDDRGDETKPDALDAFKKLFGE